MKYKCHFCEKVLGNGVFYTLECECGNCSILFDKMGNISSYLFSFFDEKGKYYNIIKSQIETGTTLYVGQWFKLKHVITIDLTVPIEDGMPQVYKFFEKLQKYVLFS